MCMKMPAMSMLCMLTKVSEKIDNALKLHTTLIVDYFNFTNTYQVSQVKKVLITCQCSCFWKSCFLLFVKGPGYCDTNTTSGCLSPGTALVFQEHILICQRCSGEATEGAPFPLKTDQHFKKKDVAFFIRNE